MIKTETDESGRTIVTRIEPEGKEPTTFLYESTTPSGAIVRDSTAAIGVELEPVFLEQVTETVERSKGFLEGIKFGIGIPKIGKFEFVKKHTKETKTRKTAIFRYPQKR